MLDGGVPGDLGGLPNYQLAVLPGAAHIAVMEKTDRLLAIISSFLDAPCHQPRDQPHTQERMMAASAIAVQRLYQQQISHNLPGTPGNNMPAQARFRRRIT